MVKRILVLASNTLRESIRQRFFLVVFFLGVVFIALSLLLGELSFDERQRILADIGLSVIDWCLVSVALFSGSTMMGREIERQTCLLVLARPVGRAEFMLGKFFGVVFVLALSLFLLYGLLLGLLGSLQSPVGVVIIGLSLLFKSILLLAVALCFANVVRPALSFMAGFSVYILGHWLEDLEFFARKSGEDFFEHGVKALAWLTPNFHRFNWKTWQFLSESVAAVNGWAMTVHTLSWTLAWLLLACLLFARRDIV
ncbi:MAG: ABC transporter permease [Bdellovibrionaceae bacterium]|nr:ABC transporter permease [Pseudobdellovibrionaceae bacterium]